MRPPTHPAKSLLNILLVLTGVWPIVFLARASKEAVDAYNHPYARAKRRETQLSNKEVKVKRRKRALTLTPNEKRSWGNGKKRVTCGQEHSLLFGLPPELRLAIYEMCVGKEDINVLWIDGSGGCRKIQGIRKGSGEDGKKISDEEKSKRRLDVLPLLQTCRRIYTEFITLLYANPTYTFTTPLSFLVFSWSIPPPRFHAIRHLSLDLGRDEARYPHYCLSMNGLQNGSFERHPLMQPFFTRFLLGGKQMSYYNTSIPAPGIFKDEEKDYIDVISTVVSQMCNLEILRVVVRTAELQSWLVHKDNGFARLAPLAIVLDRNGRRKGEKECRRTVEIIEMGNLGLEIQRVAWKLCVKERDGEEMWAWAAESGRVGDVWA